MPTINAADGYFFCAFYIKSQHPFALTFMCFSYFFCAFYIKSQLREALGVTLDGYFFCAFYIKSQRLLLVQ